MSRKIRELARDLVDAGFTLLPGGGDGDDARKHRERRGKRAIEEADG